MTTAQRASTIELQVTAGYPRDAGRGLARLGPEAWHGLGLATGDAVCVRGRRATVCRAVLSEDEPGVQLDEVSRRNAGVEVGENALLEKVTPPEALRVVLVPLDADQPEPAPEALHQRLEDLAVKTGEHLRYAWGDGRRADYEVLATDPDGAVTIAAGTHLGVDRTPVPERPDVSYGDVGGLGPQLERVREIIELPLKFPEVFKRLGIDAPKGVLLYGPPGCGKTLIARAAAREIKATFFSISGPEVVHKLYGESEAHLRSIFQQAAASAPSIIFLDEIDAIAPSREKVQGEVEKRVVGQLLALMDGLAGRRQVVVVAATNRPNALDPALRRPGRFDREIAIPVPDRQGRREVLEVHSRPMPLAKDVDLAWLAGRTHGFVGADLAALCREAAMSRLRRILAEVDLAKGGIPPEKLDGVEVEMDDFLSALHEVQPSALREVAIEVPDVRWTDVGGLEAVKERLAAVFAWPLEHPELFAAARVRPTKGILLQGPPGCGKTLLARALAAESGVNFIAVKGPELLSQYVGESEERLRELFQKARRASPAILFFDEVDALFPTRHESGVDSRTAERLLSQFLAELDGIEELKDVLVLGATNRPDLLDPALLRPDRFDEVITVGLPDEAARRAVFAVHLEGKPLAEEPDLHDLARRTDGWSAAEIAEAVRRAALVAIARLLAAAESPDPAMLRIGPADLDAGLGAVRS